MANTCDNCGTRLQGGVCPNCHEETLILDQYREQDMTPPGEDSEFMKRVHEQADDIARQNLSPNYFHPNLRTSDEKQS